MGSPNNRPQALEKIYCDAVQAQKGGALVTTDPWIADSPESVAWLQGFADSEGGVLDLSCCGYPVAAASAPELSENRY